MKNASSRLQHEIFLKKIAGAVLLIGASSLGVPAMANPFAREAKSAPVVAQMHSQIDQLEVQRKLAQAQQSKKIFEFPVTVLIYGDEATFSPALAGREIRFLENTFKLPVVAYSVSNAQEVIDTLKGLTNQKALVQNLIVRGLHGGTYQSVPSFEIQDRAHDDFSSLGFDDLKDAGVSLNFAANAFVFFDSCSMIEKETPPSVQIATGQMKKIGFKTGWIYMNHEEGSYAVGNTFAVPFYGERTTRGKINKLAAQAIWPIALPFYAYMDHFKRNHGFLVAESGDHELILKAHAFDVEDGTTAGDFFYYK